MTSHTLLFLSGGGHTGRNVLAALGDRRDGLRLVTTTDIADEPSLYQFDGAYLAPAISLDPKGFADRFAQILAEEKPTLVIPCRDEDVAWLARYANAHKDSKTAFLCGDADLARTVCDKWLSAEFCVAHDLPFVATITKGTEADLDQFIALNGLPLVAKPRNGAEARGIFVVSNRQQAAHALALPGYVLQQFLGEPQQIASLLNDIENVGIPLFHTLEGRKRSIQILIGPQGNTEHIICTINEHSGRNARSVTVDESPEALEIGRRCATVFANAGWRGPMNIQCQPDMSGALKIHEFNARFTGATAARALLGFDEVGVAVRAFTGYSIAALPSSGTTVRARESLSARAVAEVIATQFQDDGTWSRAANTRHSP
jgi:ATP-grasp in the biosynthetic pathway with Ter operon